MSGQFELPVGSHADVKELEYISALLQTAPVFRRDGSIEAEDVALLLKSRFGIQVDNLQITEQEILVELAGSTDSKVMDIRHLASLLLIPHLAKLKDSADNDDGIQRIHRVLCADLRGQSFTAQNSQPLALTRKLIQQLFQNNQVDADELPEDVVDEMLQAAGGEGTEFTPQSLLQALTHDLSGYDVRWESSLSTSYADILGANPSKKMGTASMWDLFGSSRRPRPSSNALNIEEPELKQELPDKVKKVVTLSEMDNVAETYASQTFSVLLWVAFICVFLSYVYSNEETRNGMIDCESFGNEFACKVKNAIINWLSILVQLILLGGTFFAFSSAGNSIFVERGCTSVLRVLVGMATVIFFTIVPLHVTIENWFINSNYATSNGLYKYFPYIAYATGIILLLIQLQTILRLAIASNLLKRYQTWLIPGATRKELQSKQAAAFKTNRLVENALTLHPTKTTSKSDQPTSSNALANFLVSSVQTQYSKGVIWAWRCFLDGSICREEGIWFHTRLLATSIAQVLVFFVSIALLYWVLDEVNQTFEDAQANAEETLSTDAVGALARWFADNAERSEVIVGLGAGAAVAFLSTFWTLFYYIPNFIFNVMKFRYGVIGSLYSADFETLYRRAVDNTTNVFGLAFWAQLFSAFFAFAIAGFLAFICVWGRSTSFVQSIVAQLVGIITTLVLKVGILYFTRKALLAGFYRRKLAQANILFVLLEAWNIAITTGLLVARTIVFLVLAIFYIGRIDSPFLAPGIDKIVAPLPPLDRAPIFYRQDLLQHEAHRHPYIDRLAGLFLLKLSLGDAFGTRAGSCWRLLYTLTLMPWLRKYAVNSDTGGEMMAEEEMRRASHLHAGASVRGASPRELMLEDEVARLRAQSQRLHMQVQKLQDTRTSATRSEKPKALEEVSELEDQSEEGEVAQGRESAFSV